MVDISVPGFDPASVGVRANLSDVMGRIHAVAGDGSVVTGVEVFRRAYQAVGYGWMAGWTGWPILRPITDAMYRLFARNRHLLKGKRAMCADGACKV
jgi:predicted DCC family thiol-disulfide oxidoreductase YuxK